MKSKFIFYQSDFLADKGSAIKVTKLMTNLLPVFDIRWDPVSTDSIADIMCQQGEEREAQNFVMWESKAWTKEFQHQKREDAIV